MPELPEVEVTRRGIAPHVEGRTVTGVVLRHIGLRWPFPADLGERLAGHIVRATSRRGKYLLIGFDHGTLIVHLGMSGHLRMLPLDTQAQKHDHFDLVLEDQVMRLTDPRRFGAVLWHPHEEGAVDTHLLLRGLGVEPLETVFSGEMLYRQTRNRTAPIKQVLLAGDIVVGVGNIYASESLFEAGINPKTAGAPDRPCALRQAGAGDPPHPGRRHRAGRQHAYATLWEPTASPAISSRAISSTTGPASHAASAAPMCARSVKGSARPSIAQIVKNDRRC